MAQLRVSSSSANEAVRQKLRSTTADLLKQHFGSTLNTVPDMVNIFMALMLRESSFNVNAEFSHPLSPFTSSGAFDYQNSTAIQQILTSGEPQKIANESQGRTALGLTQVMGWNVVRGASKALGGKCLVEKYRHELAGTLCVNPGDDIRSKLQGEGNISNSILAGLVVLESKYNYGPYYKNGNWVVKVNSVELTFPSRIYAAVAGYLGYASGGDANSTTYLAYANDIIGGSFYRLANGSSAPSVYTSNPQSATVASAGPTTSGTTGSLPGCIAAAG